ncbi:MAG: anaerobic ribonucleoside-triphosphate reductase activating protein [Clostridium sp.]|nr:anaerobic ribonucleoside-triphosphate reductase activating protein [Clostridium sp.]
MIRVLDIIEETMVDGPGFRTAIYVAGCEHACPGCHNPQSWSREGGRPMPVEELLELVERDEWADVTLTGGDPFYQAEEVADLARAIKQRTCKSVWCYTGFRYEQIVTHAEMKKLLLWIDVLVDGPYVAALRTTELPFRGSSNQRLIDVPASLSAGEVVCYEL